MTRAGQRLWFAYGPAGQPVPDGGELRVDGLATGRRVELQVVSGRRGRMVFVPDAGVDEDDGGDDARQGASFGLGPALLALRLEHGYTTRELAYRVGVHHMTILKAEAGRSSHRTLTAIAHAMGVQITIRHAGHGQLLHEALRSRRTELRRSQSEVARAINVEPCVVCNFERGRKVLRPKHLCLLVKELDTWLVLVPLVGTS